ncbi:MAG: C-GCAxxG-C-C family (seleno)protein [Faecalibacterium sp.]
MLKEVAQKYYLSQDYNCAEAIVLAGNELYGLGLDPQDVFLLSGFGGGIGCGKTCGAVAGSIALLGRLQLKQRAHETPDFAKNCAAFIAAVEAEYGSADCAVLKPKFMRPETRCFGTVEAIADVFEAHLTKCGIAK